MHTRPSLRIICLGSGSSGNALVVSDGQSTVLVDCGFSAREVSRRMVDAGIEPSSVDAIVLTHEHNDHIRGLDVFTRRSAPRCLIYASRGTLGGLFLPKATSERASSVVAGEPFQVGEIEVLPFATSHDASEPLGYRFKTGTDSIGVVTDTGVLTEGALEALAGCSTIGIECNHDIDMLERGPYPAFLKRRIRSHAGHLANEDAADAIERLSHDGLSRVYALHRSRTNNTARLAAAALEDRLERVGLDAAVVVASQDEVCDSDPAQQSLFET